MEPSKNQRRDITAETDDFNFHENECVPKSLKSLLSAAGIENLNLETQVRCQRQLVTFENLEELTQEMENNEGIGKMGLQERQGEKEYEEKRREKDVPQSCQDLLSLEGNNPLASKGSVLLVCKNDDLLQFETTKTNPPNTKPVISTVPRSQFLGKVKDFLGVMSESNKRLQLEAVDKSKDYNIEALSGNESEYIEMDLMLGIADLHTPEAIAAAEFAIAGNQPLVPVADTSSEEESEDSSDADDCGSTDNDETEKDSCSPTEHRRKPVEDKSSSNEALKKPRTRKRPKIVALS